MFGNLTFVERRTLVNRLRSGVHTCMYERDALTCDPRAVCYPGQTAAMYRQMIDDLQAVVDDVQAVDRVRVPTGTGWPS
jgi:hypothetical protein